MSALKKLSSEKKYVLGIFATGIIYIAVRGLFAIDTDLFGIGSHPATVGATVFCSAYTILLCALLSLAVVFCPKKGMNLLPAVPFILVCGLGICRFYISGDVYSPAAIVFLITLACNLISSLTGFHFIGTAAILSAFFITPSTVPAVCAAVCMGPFCDVNSENIKKKNLSYLSIALNLLLTLALCGYGFSHNENTSVADSDTQSIVIAVIFAVIYLIPFVTVCVKKGEISDKLVCFMLFITFGLAFAFTAVYGAMPPVMTVICSAALPVTALVFIKAESCPQTCLIFRKISDNRPLYLLILAFFIRAVGFFIVDFENIVS